MKIMYTRFFLSIVFFLLSNIYADTIVCPKGIPEDTNKLKNSIRHYLYYLDKYTNKELGAFSSSVRHIDVQSPNGLIDSTKPYSFYSLTSDGFNIEMLAEQNELPENSDFYYKPDVQLTTKPLVLDKKGIAAGGVICGIGGFLSVCGISYYSINHLSGNPAIFLIFVSPGIILSTTGMVKMIHEKRKLSTQRRWESRYQ
jgi:hypothetical protein